MYKSYESLIVWQKAHELCKQIYKSIADFPNTERYRLIDQLCRAAASVPGNIVEGSARLSFAEKRHFLTIAMGSLDEAHYYLRLAFELGYLPETTYKHASSLAEEVSILIVRFRRSFR